MTKTDSLGKRIRIARIQADLNSKDMAGKLGVSTGLYSKYENNDRTPKLSVLLAICRETGTTPNELIGDDYLTEGGADANLS